MVVFIVIYAFFDRSPPSPHVGTTAPDAGYSGWWIALSGGLGLAIPTMFFTWLIGGSRRFNMLQVAAFEALSDGDHARAAQLFGDLARRFSHRPNFGRLAAYNQGYALIRSGAAAAAVGVLLGIERRVDFGVDGIRRLAVTELARAFAIGGDVEKAKRWLGIARERTTGLGDTAQELAQLATVEGLVLCRAGRFEDAVRHYEQTWPRLEARLALREMREVWLLRAFAVGSTSTPRHGGATDMWLRLLRSTQPSSFDWLTADWPELATFAVTHEIALAPALPPSVEHTQRGLPR
jgi:hypothetical protein